MYALRKLAVPDRQAPSAVSRSDRSRRITSPSRMPVTNNKPMSARWVAACPHGPQRGGGCHQAHDIGPRVQVGHRSPVAASQQADRWDLGGRIERLRDVAAKTTHDSQAGCHHDGSTSLGSVAQSSASWVVTVVALCSSKNRRSQPAASRGPPACSRAIGGRTGSRR